jgi:hypothetical protein
MPPSSDGGGGAAPERIPNARAVAIVDRVNPPSHTHTLERRRLRGVGYIEPNDEIGQRPAVLSLPSLVAVGWIAWRGLNGRVLTSKRCDGCDEQGIGWSSHPTCHPSRPTSTSVGPGVWTSISTTTAQGILVVVRQSMSDIVKAIKDWPTATTPHKKSHDK